MPAAKCCAEVKEKKVQKRAGLCAKPGLWQIDATTWQRHVDPSAAWVSHPQQHQPCWYVSVVFPRGFGQQCFEYFS